MAIATMDGLVAALPASQTAFFNKLSFSPKASNRFHSLWMTGGNPGAAATPAIGVGEAVTSATAGAIPFSNPGLGNTLYLGRASFHAITIGVHILYDRLVQTSGLVGNTTDAQTVNSAALTRHTTGAGCQLWLEWYTTTGTGTPTASVSYTNQAGTAGRTGTTVAWDASPAVGQLLRVDLQSGDTGVRSVESVTASVATGSAGDFGITITKPIMDFSFVGANHSQLQDAITLGLPIIVADACLAIMALSSTTSHFSTYGIFNFIEG